jgi:hypothetical protein
LRTLVAARAAGLEFNARWHVRKLHQMLRRPALTICNVACSNETESTGKNSYLGYFGPFKARRDSVDMAKDHGQYKTLWNGFPNLFYRGEGRRGHNSG